MSKDDLNAKDVLFLGHLKRVFALLGPLREVGCERDSAGNRKLFFDDYVKIVLLYTWNPLICSLRDLQAVVELPKVAKALGVTRFSLGSFSESVRLFDRQALEPIIEELARDLEPNADPRLKDLKDALTLVDGTVIRALVRLAKSAVGINARYNTTRDGQPVYGWRLHTQFDLQYFKVHRIDRTGARNAGQQRENNVLRNTLQAGRCYVGDGHYADKSLFDDIVDAQSSYVVRAAENSVHAILEERLLSQEALDAGVELDAVVTLQANGQPLRHPVRRIELKVAPHPRRSLAKVSTQIILHTCLLDVPPELIALIYHYRYTVELFFRMLKQLLGLRHLLSQREEGIDIQINCALIVCLMIQLISGKKPNKAMRNIIGWYLLGLADAQDVINALNKPDNTGVKKRARQAELKKMGF